MLTRESTLIHLRRYFEEFGEWPTGPDLAAFVPDRLRAKVHSRVDALVRGGHVTVDDTGRIVRATGTTPTETF